MTMPPIMSVTDEMLAEIELESAMAAELNCNAAVAPAHLEALLSERAELKRDAERYRWLRDKSESIHQFYLSTPIWFTGVKFSKDNVDGTIDAAMSQGEQSGG